MIQYQYFPKSKMLPDHLKEIVEVFYKYSEKINSEKFEYKSNEVLEIINKDLENIGYKVEKGKQKEDIIEVPVLFGLNGKMEKSFQADGLNSETKTVIEVEAGRAVTNYQFLKDLFEACIMFDVNYLVIAVRNIYRKSQDFQKVITFFDTLYASGRLKLPLEGILVIGY